MRRTAGSARVSRLSVSCDYDKGNKSQWMICFHCRCLQMRERALQKCSYKKVFWKYAAKLQSNFVEVTLRNTFSEHIFSEHLFLWRAASEMIRKFSWFVNSIYFLKIWYFKRWEDFINLLAPEAHVQVGNTSLGNSTVFWKKEKKSQICVNDATLFP